jgi:rubrerythrin
VGIQIEESVATQATDPDVQVDEVQLDDPGFLDFAVAGVELAGEFRCADCGYGAVIQRVLPVCPMCGGTVWESRAQRFGR